MRFFVSSFFINVTENASTFSLVSLCMPMLHYETKIEEFFVGCTVFPSQEIPLTVSCLLTEIREEEEEEEGIRRTKNNKRREEKKKKKQGNKDKIMEGDESYQHNRNGDNRGGQLGR